MGNATNQKIRDLLADGDVDSLTKMVLINAVYFKANWKFAFNPEETFTSSFRGTNGSIPNVDYLSRDATVRVLRDESRQLDILELPYDDPTKSMLIVLPKESAGSDDMAGRLSGLDLSTVRTEGRLANTGIFVPKFKIAGWRVEADSTAVGGCKGVEDRVETPETKKKCKTIKNKLKAAEFLQCSL